MKLPRKMDDSLLYMVCQIPRKANMSHVLEPFYGFEVLADHEFKLEFYRDEHDKICQRLSPYLTVRIKGLYQN